jgi:hypothetical protein
MSICYNDLKAALDNLLLFGTNENEEFIFTREEIFNTPWVRVKIVENDEFNGEYFVVPETWVIIELTPEKLDFVLRRMNEISFCSHAVSVVL